MLRSVPDLTHCSLFERELVLYRCAVKEVTTPEDCYRFKTCHTDAGILPSFRQRPEFSLFNMFWTPALAGVTVMRSHYF